MERRKRNTFEDLATVEPLLGTCPSMCCLDPIVETRPGQQNRISGIGGLPVYALSTPCSKEPCSTFCSDGDGERGASSAKGEGDGSGSQLNSTTKKQWKHRRYVSCPCSEMDVLSNVSASKEKGTPFEHKTKRTDESPTRLARLRTFGTFSGRMPSQTVQAQESKHKMEL